MHKARKRFGQNFLHDPHVIQQIINAINPAAEQTLVEIGPGLGAITLSLLQFVDKLEAIELDRDLIPLLQEKLQRKAQQIPKKDPQQLGKLIIHEADALTFEYCTLADNEKKLRLTGNLPYNISTPLLLHLLKQTHCIQDMHFMLQKEVVDRIVASPGNKDYGRLSVIIQYHCITKSLFKISPGAFSPPPKVESAFIRLVPYEKPPCMAKDITLLEQVTSKAFGQRRKTLRNSLKGLLTEDQISALDIDPTQRAETLTIKQYVALSNQLFLDQSGSE